MTPERDVHADPAAFGAVSKSALGTQIADRLRESILRGRFSPGDQLREGQLADSFSVSRGPIRDALVELRREGLVDMEPHRTATVARFTPADLEELYSLRVALDVLAIRCVVQRVGDSDLEALERAVDAFRAIDAESSEHDVARADLAFHDAIYAAAHHGRLRQTWLSLRSQVYLFLVMRNLTNPPFTERVVADHRAILAQVRARDEAGAVRVVQQHLTEPYLGLLEQGDPGAT